jgi:hypothetical protein
VFSVLFFLREETTKIAKENSTEKPNGKHTEGDDVKEGQRTKKSNKKQRSRIFQAYENKYPTHLKMVM